jgi:hypothetical protein
MPWQDSWDRFNDQFRETFDETQDRWRAIRAKRKAESKCWQCAKLIAACTCPNVKHAINAEDGCHKGDRA